MIRDKTHFFSFLDGEWHPNFGKELRELIHQEQLVITTMLVSKLMKQHHDLDISAPELAEEINSTVISPEVWKNL